jgi:hypothetical protein
METINPVTSGGNRTRRREVTRDSKHMETPAVTIIPNSSGNPPRRIASIEEGRKVRLVVRGDK